MKKPIMKKPIKKVMNPTTASSETLQKINHHNDWPQPVPVVEKSTSAPYPTDALPAVVQKAVSSYHHYGQQPLPLIASSALAKFHLPARQTLTWPVITVWSVRSLCICVVQDLGRQSLLKRELNF